VAGLRGIHAENTVLINAVGNNGKCSATHVNSRVLCFVLMLFVLMLFVLFCLGATNLRFYGELGRVPPFALALLFGTGNCVWRYIVHLSHLFHIKMELGI